MKDIQPTSLIDQVNHFVNQNKTAVLGLVVLVVAGFGGYAIYSSYNHKYEDKAQSAFFEAERMYAANQPAPTDDGKPADTSKVDTTKAEEN